VKTHAILRAGSAYLLSGLAICARCGAALVGDSVPARVSTDGYPRQRWRFYLCGARKARHACDLPRLDADALEAAVAHAVLDEILTAANLAAQVAALSAQLDSERPALASQRQALADELVGTDRGLARLLDAIEASPDSSALAGRLAQRESERGDLALRLAELDARLAGPPAAPVPLDDLRAALASGPLDARQSVLRSLVARILVDVTTARILYRLPTSGGRSMVLAPLGALLIDLPIIWRQQKAPSPPHS
jgi:hypothetical protein